MGMPRLSSGARHRQSDRLHWTEAKHVWPPPRHFLYRESAFEIGNFLPVMVLVRIAMDSARKCRVIPVC